MGASMGAFLQALVAQAAIAVSVFSLITYLWLGMTVLLNGNRASRVTWIGGAGLLLAGVFFLCHGALVGAGVPSGPSPTDVWWVLAWAPAFAAPIFWAATGLHYADLAGVWPRFRLPALQAVGLLGALAALLALLSWPAVAHYGDFIRLLDESLRLRHPAPPPAAATPALPALGVAFVLYVGACAALPWVSLALIRRRTPTNSAPANASRRATPAGREATLLWDAADAWSHARPALLAASFCMMVAGLLVALIGVLTSLATHFAGINLAPGATPLPLPVTRPGHVPLVLVAADLLVQLALAGVGLTIGWAVVRQGILIERRLPQRGFLSHWRGMAIVAAILACVIAAMADIEPQALPELLILVALVSAAAALFTWQSYVAHDRILAQLRPFVDSLAVGHAGWLATDPHDVEQNIAALFTSLCRDVLGAARGRLSLSAGRLHRTFSYEAPPETQQDWSDEREWSLPISDERGVVARIALGPRVDGAGYTSADLEVARACGQRILDAVGEFAAAQAIATLARRRGVESELSAALPRRVLHDEVLPRLHLAMLRLEALRARLPGAATNLVKPAATATSETRGELGEVVRELGQAHRDLAALMRAAPMANLRRLEHGLVSALRGALDGEFRGSFDSVDWQVSEQTRQRADALSPIVAELALGATLEVIRNAGRHGRGANLHRRLNLWVALDSNDQWLSIVVRDDGVGVQSTDADLASEAPTSTTLWRSMPDAQNTQVQSTHSGLLTHSALVTLVGGALTMQSPPGMGATVTIRVPLATRDATPVVPDALDRLFTPAAPDAPSPPAVSNEQPLTAGGTAT